MLYKTGFVLPIKYPCFVRKHLSWHLCDNIGIPVLYQLLVLYIGNTNRKKVSMSKNSVVKDVTASSTSDGDGGGHMPSPSIHFCMIPSTRAPPPLSTITHHSTVHVRLSLPARKTERKKSVASMNTHIQFDEIDRKKRVVLSTATLPNSTLPAYQLSTYT